MADPNGLEAPLAAADADGIEAPFAAADPFHVEILDVVRQAMVLARRLEPQVEISRVFVPELSAGLLDLRTGRRENAWISFGFLRHDPGLPPGQDLMPVQVLVSLVGSTLEAHRSRLWKSGQPLFEPLPMPQCSVFAAWRAAVASGVPASAVATLATWQVQPGGESVWGFTVGGGDEHLAGAEERRREVDMRTCAVRKHGRARIVTPAPAAKAPLRTRCGCAAGDRTCQANCRGGGPQMTSVFVVEMPPQPLPAPSPQTTF